jgi:hypothetical protein
MENNKDGNFFNLSIEEIEEAVARLYKDFAETDIEVIKNQYLSLAEYWGRVLRNMRR